MITGDCIRQLTDDDEAWIIESRSPFSLTVLNNGFDYKVGWRQCSHEHRVCLLQVSVRFRAYAPRVHQRHEQSWLRGVCCLRVCPQVRG
jgi:hypothetical protein